MDTNKKNKSLYLSKSICIIHISNNTAILNQCNMVTVSANVKKVDKWLKCQVNVGKILRQFPFVYGDDFLRWSSIDICIQHQTPKVWRHTGFSWLSDVPHVTGFPFLNGYSNNPEN